MAIETGQSTLRSVWEGLGELVPDGRVLEGLHVISDTLIGLSYVAISLMLLYLVHRAGRGIPYPGVFVAFGTFIIACGATHFMHVAVLVNPAAWWGLAAAQMVTVIASVATAVLLPPLLPRALALVEAARLSNERKARLEATNRELETLYRRLKALDELKTQFFANVSHELRTPLMLILGPAARLRETPGLSDGQRRKLEVIELNARTLLTHVDDLLDVARLEAGQEELRLAQVDLARLVRLGAAHFEALAAERGITLTVETPPILTAAVDPGKIQRLLLNLLGNAFKFTPAGGTVRCTLAAEAERVVLAVADSGPGVPPALRATIFERFRQVDASATRRVGGIGLGLAIAREFVALHGGSIAVDDAPEGGARFRVELPLTAAGAAVEAPPAPAGGEQAENVLAALRTAEQPGPAGATVPDDERPLVLVVEDNPEMRRFLAESLAPEYRSVAAADGEAGLALARELRPDLILTDLMMPCLSGDGLVRAVRALAQLEAIPIVLLTARTDEALRVETLRAGAQDYLTKPFSVEELRARVGNLIAIKRARATLQQALASQSDNVAALAAELTKRTRALEAALAELGEREAREHELRQAAEAASRAKDDFLSTAAHELKTPVTTLKGFTQMLARWSPEERTRHQAQTLTVLDRQCDRLARLVEDLLNVSRLAVDGLEYRPEPVEVGTLAAEVVERMQGMAGERRLRLTLDSPAWVEAEPDRLDQVLVNLLSNAIKFSPNGGEIDVRVSTCGDEARVAVRDEGIGIPAERQGQIFERFYRAHAGTEHEYDGMGIGLHLSRQLVVRQGGQMWFESEEGRGSTFSFSLPLAKGTADGRCAEVGAGGRG